MSARGLGRGLLVLATLVAAGVVFEVSAGNAGIDRVWIDAAVRGQGLRGALLFIAAGAAGIAAGMPRQSLCFLGGYAFGFIDGAALGLIATALGSIAAFYYARLLARDYLRARFHARLREIDARLSRRPFLAALWLRLLPLGNNLLTNLAAGVASVPAAPFFAGSALGYVPQTVAFALAGSGIGVEPLARTGLSAALFIASSMVGAWLYRRLPPAARAAAHRSVRV